MRARRGLSSTPTRHDSAHARDIASPLDWPNPNWPVPRLSLWDYVPKVVCDCSIADK